MQRKFRFPGLALWRAGLTLSLASLSLAAGAQLGQLTLSTSTPLQVALAPEAAAEQAMPQLDPTAQNLSQGVQDARNTESIQLSDLSSQFDQLSDGAKFLVIQKVMQDLEPKDLQYIYEETIASYEKYKFNPQELGPLLKPNQEIKPFLHKLFDYSLCPSLAEVKNLVQAQVVPGFRAGHCVVHQVELGDQFTPAEINLLLPHIYATFLSAYENRVSVHSFSKNFHEQYVQYRATYEKAVKSYFANPQLIPDENTGKLVFSSINSYVHKRESFGEFHTYEQVDTMDYISHKYSYATNLLAIGDKWMIPVAILLAYGDETDDYRAVLMEKIAREKDLPHLTAEDFHDVQFTAAGLQVYYDDEETDADHPQFAVFPVSRLVGIFDSNTLVLMSLFTAPNLNPAAKEFQELRKRREEQSPSTPPVAPVSSGAPI